MDFGPAGSEKYSITINQFYHFRSNGDRQLKTFNYLDTNLELASINLQATSLCIDTVTAKRKAKIWPTWDDLASYSISILSCS